MLIRKILKKKDGMTMVEVLVAFTVLMICMAMVAGAIHLSSQIQMGVKDYRNKTQEIEQNVMDDKGDTRSVSSYEEVFKDGNGNSFRISGYEIEKKFDGMKLHLFSNEGN